MCEQFVARAAEPFPLDALWPLAERMERNGIAGFGWGVTWLGVDGAVPGQRDSCACRVDMARDRIGWMAAPSVIVHPRRPSRLSMMPLPDTRPFIFATGATNRRVVRLTGTVALDGHGTPTDPSPACPARRPGARV